MPSDPENITIWSWMTDTVLSCQISYTFNFFKETSKIMWNLSVSWWWLCDCYIPGKNWQHLFIKRFISLFFYEIVEIVVKEREIRNYQDLHQVNIQYIQWVLLLHFASTRLIQGQLKTFNRFCFFFVPGSYLLSTLASFVHLDDFSLPLNPRQSGLPTYTHTGPTPKIAECLVSVLLCADSVFTTWGWKLPSLYICLCTLLSSISPMQFTWHFCCHLFTLRHSCILFLKSTNTACQRSICNMMI